MITKEDLEIVQQEIIKNRKPIETFVQVKKENKIEKIPVAIIINTRAKSKQIKRGYVPITINEIEELTKDKNTFQDQQEAVGKYIIQAKEFYLDTVEKVVKTFKGKYIDIK